MAWRGIIEEYRQFLPVTEKTPVKTLGEGNTPLIKAERLADYFGFGGQIYLKYEGANPTGSFKDRGMTLAVSKAIEDGSKVIVCASTGNTSASASAYAAVAGLRCVVVLPHGKVAKGKLTQALIYGAEIISIRGNFDKAMEIAKWLSENCQFALVNSLNPYRLEGQKTAAFEICEQLGRSPDYHFIPVGNGGNITAYWRGYKEYYRLQYWKTILPFAVRFYPPKMVGIQAAGAAPIVLGHRVENPETIASAIRIGNPTKWQDALGAVRDSGGRIDMVTDEEILLAQKLVARLEGVFCEPASAASVAGLLKMYKSGVVAKNSVIVCTLTGSGLKDPAVVQKVVRLPRPIDPDLDKIIKMIKL